MFHAKNKNIDITLEWKTPCAVRRAELTPMATGAFQALIYASEGADSAQLAKLRDSLRRKGVNTYLDKHGKEDVLIARGIRGEELLLAALEDTQCIEGQMIRSTTKNEALPKRTNTRFLSALFYDLGNIACIVSGIQRGRHNLGGKFTMNDISELMVGASFSVGDILMTIYSSPEDEMARLAKGFEAYMANQGIVLPTHDDMTPETLHKSGGFAGASDFIQHNMIGIKCLTETAAGLFMTNAALKKGNFNPSKLAAGLLVTTGWFSTFLMDKFKPELPDHDGGMLDKIRANPRGWLARPAAIGNNFFNLHGAYHERKRFQQDIMKAEDALSGSATAQKSHADLTDSRRGGLFTNDRQQNLGLARSRQHDYAANVFAACSFLVANYLFGISENKNKKNVSDEEQRIANEMVSIAANALYKLPAQHREAAIAEAATYTAGQPHMTLSAADIARQIENKIEDISQNPFLLAEHNAPGRGAPSLS